MMADGRVTALGVGDVAVARREAGQRRQGPVSPTAEDRNLARAVGVGEAVPFAVVRSPRHHRLHQADQIRRIHLAVPCEHHHQVKIPAKGLGVPAGDGPPNPPPALAAHELDPGICGLESADPGPGGVHAGVVHHEDSIHHRGHGLKHPGDLLGFVVGGDHRGDAKLAHHRSPHEIGSRVSSSSRR